MWKGQGENGVSTRSYTTPAVTTAVLLVIALGAYLGSGNQQQVTSLRGTAQLVTAKPVVEVSGSDSAAGKTAAVGATPLPQARVPAASSPLPAGATAEGSATAQDSTTTQAEATDEQDAATAQGSAAAAQDSATAKAAATVEERSTEDEAAIRLRARSAVLGALVADAATMGLHWIYDTGKIRSILEGSKRTAVPEFFEPPQCPFYQYKSGQQSPYGDELLPVLLYLDEHGTLDDSNGQAFAEYLAAYYKAYKGRLNKTSKAMMEALLDKKRPWPQCGDPTDNQANAFVKVIPIVARYAGMPGLPAAVDAAVRAQQNSDAAVGYGLTAAHILEAVVMGSTVAEAVQSAADAAGTTPLVPESMKPILLDALDNQAATLKDLVWVPGSETKAGRWGASCHNPGAFQASIVAALQAAGNYTSGVRANMMLGGDNCSRSVLIGALLAAQGGMKAVPEAWRGKMTRFEEMQKHVDHLIGYRKAASR